MTVLTEAEKMSALARFTQNDRAFRSRYEDLLTKYPNKWIAFHNGEVRATGKSLNEVLQRAERARVPRKIICLHYMDPDPAVTIL